ncbi:glycosyltransferase family 2 protein [Leifsonia shinshuensis]|uniref:glycosyltransferase family 2 protein n=1 Tax=Leifsonia shinshuensis TaxID=150026 RepID=UPI002863468E|nr:glycosyltransferase family 2 protein [Leifsonia shinshuensis]MDR6973255.1 glycosyltransferase involved in cell wall biosynthesis [Leifsonia shinshuensis]
MSDPQPAGAAPAISVALCTHNGARFVRRQLAGILAQTLPPAQLVISDDASVDDTVAIVEQELTAHRASGAPLPVVVLLRNAYPLGVTANFEQALRACEGSLIALSDQDDEWEPDKLERMAAYFASRPGLGFLHTDATLIDDDSRPAGGTLFGVLEVSDEERAAVHSGRAFDVFVRRNLATGATAMVSADLLAAALPFPAEWVHDEWLAIQAAARDRLDLSERPLTRYRRHDENQIGAGDPTLRHKVGRVLGRRGERNRQLAVRSRLLADRLAGADDVPGEHRALAEEKAEFEAARAAFPASRLARALPVLRLARRGQYPRLASRGRLDVLRDLLQPA